VSNLPRLNPFKTGDTYNLACRYRDAGVPQDLTGATIRAQIRTPSGGLVATLEPTLADQDDPETVGRFTLAPDPADTTGWPIGAHLADIEITIGGVIRSTETFVQPVVRDQTR
jgi:hypothetical protein